MIIAPISMPSSISLIRFAYLGAPDIWRYAHSWHCQAKFFSHMYMNDRDAILRAVARNVFALTITPISIISSIKSPRSSLAGNYLSLWLISSPRSAQHEPVVPFAETDQNFTGKWKKKEKVRSISDTAISNRRSRGSSACRWPCRSVCPYNAISSYRSRYSPDTPRRSSSTIARNRRDSAVAARPRSRSGSWCNRRPDTPAGSGCARWPPFPDCGSTWCIGSAWWSSSSGTRVVAYACTCEEDSRIRDTRFSRTLNFPWNRLIRNAPDRLRKGKRENDLAPIKSNYEFGIAKLISS